MPDLIPHPVFSRSLALPHHPKCPKSPFLDSPIKPGNHESLSDNANSLRLKVRDFHHPRKGHKMRTLLSCFLPFACLAEALAKAGVFVIMLLLFVFSLLSFSIAIFYSCNIPIFRASRLPSSDLRPLVSGFPFPSLVFAFMNGALTLIL
jgi:hypothetical protein